MNSALFVVVLITGLALVGAALLIAGLISPRRILDAVQSRLLLVCHSVFDVRRRNGILVPVGGYIERFRCSRII